ADATEDGHPREVTFEPSTWASIVASVSSEGETSATYREALALHTREPQPPDSGQTLTFPGGPTTTAASGVLTDLRVSTFG
ncbi:MAG TPA: hypothetical protein VHA75_20265, partial [Rugosimonospora sp.]|nr:hypothetical protein [Rugosimonospora sp.]